MATVIFFEKPGCINNTRQKKLLTAAGHQVIAKNLLTEDWQAESLRVFFGELPVLDWFNYSTPAVKLGEIDPNHLTEAEALALMLANPLLIRRPLMQVGDSTMAGFDQTAIDRWIGLTEINTITDMESCTRSQAKASCSHE
jgi:nitrogenase-associated protein